MQMILNSQIATVTTIKIKIMITTKRGKRKIKKEEKITRFGIFENERLIFWSDETIYQLNKEETERLLNFLNQTLCTTTQNK